MSKIQQERNSEQILKDGSNGSTSQDTTTTGKYLMQSITGFLRIERVFCVSIRKDIDTGYTFPSPVESDEVLMDKLEPVEDIDEKYFLSSECVKYRFMKNQINEEKGYGFRFSPVERERRLQPQ